MVTVSEDVILFVPQPSIMPYEVQCVVSAVSPEGTFNAQDNTFVVDFARRSFLKSSSMSTCFCLLTDTASFLLRRNTRRKCVRAFSSSALSAGKHLLQRLQQITKTNQKPICTHIGFFRSAGRLSNRFLEKYLQGTR